MKSNIASLYEELRKATDGGSESMTHDDALKQIAYWRDKCSQVQAVEPVAWISTDCIGERTLLFTKPAWEPLPDKVEPLYIHPAPPAEAQQVAVPMTEDEIFNLWRDGDIPGGATEFEDAVRAIEKHHGIGVKP